MGALRDLAEMSREFGLGPKYFILVGAVLVMLMAGLFLWGRVDIGPSAPPSPPAPLQNQPAN